MFEPTRAMYAFRPSAPAGLVAAAVAVATLFASTPFILSEVAERFDVSLGTAGILSAVQVGSFAVTSFVAGRILRPGGRVLLVAALLGIAGNVASAFAPTFLVLLATRVIAGGASGALTWIAWADAIRDRRRLADIAAAGPLTVMVAAPILGWAVHAGGDAAVFLIIAAVHVPIVLLRPPLDLTKPIRVGPTRPARSNRVLLAALGLATAGGSSMFIFAAAFGTAEIGMSPLATSFGFSLNAAAGFIGTRLHARSGRGGWWMLGPAVSALSLVLFPAAFAFYAILAFWGLSWWLAVPEVLRSIASHTDAPDGRVGDAQAFMATGRAIGPLIGGFIITRADFTALGIVAFCIIAIAVAAIVAVELRRITQIQSRQISPT